MTRDMNNILTRLFTVLMLMIFSMGADAIVNVEIGQFKGGTIEERSQTDPDEKGLVTVVIKVTPDKGYTISQKDITVVSTYSPSGTSGTRAPEIAANLTPIEKDPEDLSQPREYSYIVSSTFGIWVKEATFKKDSSKGPVRSVTIYNLSGITDPNGSYTLASTFSTTGTAEDEDNNEIGTSTNPFKGTIDGGLVTITGTWDKPLFDYVEDATIKNVIIKTVSISTSNNTGAIAAIALGATRIYNCGINDGTISGGMLPKIENALAAVDAGVKRVIITKATAIDGQHGTVIMQ